MTNPNRSSMRSEAFAEPDGPPTQRAIVTADLASDEYELMTPEYRAWLERHVS